MRILGIDPGLTRTGLATIEAKSRDHIRPLEWLTIETDPSLKTSERLREIGDDMAKFLKEAKPDLAVCERIFFARNERTAIDVAQARGVILLTLEQHHIPILEPTPREMKLGIAGFGNASKEQLQEMLRRLLSLEARPAPPDAADALALAVFGAIYQPKVPTLRLRSLLDTARSDPEPVEGSGQAG